MLRRLFFFFTSLLDFAVFFQFISHYWSDFDVFTSHQYGTCTICVPILSAVRPFSEKWSISNWMHKWHFETHLLRQCCKDSFIQLWCIRLLWLLIHIDLIQIQIIFRHFPRGVFFSLLCYSNSPNDRYWSPGHD